jgi:hypothetical protein
MFGMKLYGTMAVLVKEIKDKGFKPEGVEAMKTLAGIIGYNSLAVGLTGNVFGAVLSSALGAYDYATGKPGPHDYEGDFRHWMTEHMGPTWSMFLSRGGSGVAGIDAIRSVGLSNMAAAPAVKSFDKAGTAQAAGDLVFGPSLGTAQNLFEGSKALLNGDWQRATDLMTPRMIHDPLRGAYGVTEGMTDARGRVIVPPDKMTTLGGIETGLGFYTTERSLPNDERARWFQDQKELQTARTAALNNFISTRDPRYIQAYMSDPDHRRFAPLTYGEASKAYQNARQAGLTLGAHVTKRQMPMFREATGL